MENTTPKFSIVLIAKNEEKTLPKLLASLKEFKERGGEIILVDTGSTDSTVQVANDGGCVLAEVGNRFTLTLDKKTAIEINSLMVVSGDEEIVKEGDTIFDYSSARNYATNLAINKWVWQPDCDEMFTAFNIEEIEKSINEPNIDQLEYDFVYAHDEEEKPTLSFKHCKMYNRNIYEWKGIIHEVLQLK